MANGIALGTAGWSIPKGAASGFPETGSHLERYASVLPAVEINSSFHRPHRRSTYERWAACVPADFRFSVKIPKAISHTLRLVDTDALLEVFVDETAGLGDKLEVVLLQLPPSFAYDPAVVAPFMARLRRDLAENVAIALEPRHPTWFEPDADQCLVEHQVARVAADPVLVPGGERPGGWQGLHYHRLHGAPRLYYSSYDAQFLASLANDIEQQDDRTRRWCIFDNTASGAATEDALALRSILSAR